MAVFGSAGIKSMDPLSKRVIGLWCNFYADAELLDWLPFEPIFSIMQPEQLARSLAAYSAYSELHISSNMQFGAYSRAWAQYPHFSQAMFQQMSLPRFNSAGLSEARHEFMRVAGQCSLPSRSNKGRRNAHWEA